MKEDEILARVGAHVRDERKDDATFERIAKGEAPVSEIPAGLEAARPLGDAAIDRIAGRIAPRGRVVPFTRRAAKWAAPVALAAAVVLFLATRGGGTAGPDLPGYGVTASGEQAMRGETAPSTRLHLGKAAGSRFEIVARPATAVGDAKVIAYAFTMEGSEPVPLDARIDVSQDGAVKIAGDARALGAASELRVVVGTPESIGKFEGALDRARSGSGNEKVRVLVVGIDRDR